MPSRSPEIGLSLLHPTLLYGMRPGWPAIGRIEKEVAGQFDQSLFIDPALELDHRIQGNPVIIPAPGIEFRMFRGPQGHVRVPSHQPQQIPDLLLSTVGGAPLAPDRQGCRRLGDG